MSSKTEAQIIRNLRGCFATFPQISPILERLTHLLQQECLNGEPDHLFIVGESGVGKSRMLEYFQSLHPAHDLHDRTVVPVLYSETPSDCTPKKLASQLLRALGSKLWNKGNEQELTHQFLVLLAECRTKMVILDEVNHLVERGGAKSHYQLADWIKLTARQSKIPFVMSGTERSIELLAVNEQLRSRFRESVMIRPFGFSTPQDSKETLAALRSFHQLLANVDRVDISSEPLSNFVIFGTHGRLREIRKLLVRWVEIGFQKSRVTLTLEDLAKAFAQVIYPGVPKGRNPFRADFNGIPLTLLGEPFAPAGRQS